MKRLFCNKILCFSFFLFLSKTLIFSEENEVLTFPVEQSESQNENPISLDSDNNIEEKQSESEHSYQITNVVYTSLGMTRESALAKNVKIDKNAIFSSEDEFLVYLEKLKQEFENTRLLENISCTYEILKDSETDIFPITLFVSVSDSKHLLLLPRPGYNSNTGAQLKLKLKDNNFLGTMNVLNFDFNGRLGTDDEPQNFSLVTLGLNFDYTYPFSVFETEDEWSNEASFSWLLGSNRPDFSYITGLTVGLPFGKNSLKFYAKQGILADTDYESYDDYLYFKENVGVKLPLVLGYVDSFTPISFTPSLSFTYYWDKNGINVENEDLIGPELSQSNEFSIEQINWIGNMRDGYSLSTSLSATWNFQEAKLKPSFDIEAKYFKTFNRFISISADFYFYGMINSSQNAVGSRLRGIRDNQTYNGNSLYALKSPMGLQFSFDSPIHIITTNWLGWGNALFGSYEELSPFAKVALWLPYKLAKYVDFELQLSPFVDFALTYNDVTERYFNPKDGYYAAGLEVLVYPLRWKSFVIRGSLGLDVGRLLLSNALETSFRDTSVSPFEIFFGLGLNY